MPLINPRIGVENIQLGYFYPHSSYQNQTENPPSEEWMYSSTAVGAFTAWWSGATSGAGSAITFLLTTQDRPGILQIQAGTAATAGARVASSQPQSIILPIASGLIEFEQAARLSALSSGAATYIARMGLTDATTTGDVTDGLYFEYAGANWFACAAAAGVRTKVNCGIAPNAGQWRTFNIRSNRSGAQDFYIDDVLRASVSATLPSASGNLTTIAPGQMVKSAGASTVNMQIDYTYFAYSFGSAR